MELSDPEDEVENDTEVERRGPPTPFEQLSLKVQKLEALLNQIAQDLGYLE